MELCAKALEAAKLQKTTAFKKDGNIQEFPGGPVVSSTWCFHYPRPGFNLWLRN